MENNSSKYRQLAGWVREKIDGGVFASGERLPSEHELSAMFGISRQTVRQAIGLLEKENYIKRRQGSGTYVLSKSPKKNAQTKSIGVILKYINDYIFPSIISGIESVLSENGYTMQLAATRNRIETEAHILQNLMSEKVDGIMVDPTQSGLPNPNTRLYNEMQAAGMPILTINTYYPGTSISYVAPDDVLMGEIATQCLVDAGHKNIAALFQSDDIQGHLRYIGYLNVMNQYGYLNSDHLYWYDTNDLSDLFENCNKILKRLENATAVICYNDQIAVKLIDFLSKRSIRIPDDISVIGIDDSNVAVLCEPQLTSVLHPKEVLGRKAAKNMLKLLDDADFEATHVFQPKLIWRNSVKNLGTTQSAGDLKDMMMR